MKLRYPAVAAVLVGLLLPSLAMAGERYRGPGMMWDGGLFHMFFGFLMLILFLAIVVGVIVLLVRWLVGSEHPRLMPLELHQWIRPGAQGRQAGSDRVPLVPAEDRA